MPTFSIDVEKPLRQAKMVSTDYAALGDKVGKVLMGDQFGKGYSDAAKSIADANLKQAHGDYYASMAENQRLRTQSQSPDYDSEIAARFAGLSGDQKEQFKTFGRTGSWGMNPAVEDEAQQMTIAPTQRAAPSPELVNKYNQGMAVAALNRSATGNSNAHQLVQAFADLTKDAQSTNALDNGGVQGLNALEAARKGSLYNFHEFGTGDQSTGGVTFNQPYIDKNNSVIAQHKAQATNATASAGQHYAQTQKLRAETNNQGLEGFTPGAIESAAARYNLDGTLPPMGMGKEGALGRRAILNRAAELSSGISPEDQRITQIGNKANTAALSKIQQQQTMVGAFEKNFVKNADIALELSAKVDRTGVPLANKWINAGKRNIAGDPELSAFDQAIKSASNEYAKIISGSMGNTAVAEGEIRKMEEKLNSAQTPEQVKEVIALMKRETQNRMTAFDDEKGQLRNSMKPSGANAAFDSVRSAETKKTFKDFGYQSINQPVLEARALVKEKPWLKADVVKRLEEIGITNHGIK